MAKRRTRSASRPKRPASYARPGAYPGSYTIRYEANDAAYMVALSDLTREGE